MHQWVAIINNSGEGNSDVSSIAGYVKISIQVTGEIDEPTEIVEDATD